MKSESFFDESGNLVARVVDFNAIQKGVFFHSEKIDTLQIATSGYGSGERVQNHTHKILERNIQTTSEVLIILKGNGLLKIFDKDRKISHEINFGSSQIISLFGGSHGLEFSESTTLIEIKQGPYMSEFEDKIKW